MAATDLVAPAKLIGFAANPDLTRLRLKHSDPAQGARCRAGRPKHGTTVGAEFPWRSSYSIAWLQLSLWFVGCFDPIEAGVISADEIVSRYPILLGAERTQSRRPPAEEHNH